MTRLIRRRPLRRRPVLTLEGLLARAAFAREHDLQEAILHAAALLGWEPYHTFDSRRSPPGFPDLVLVRPPRCLFAELKMPSGRLTRDQARWRLLLAACPGLEYHLWTPREWVSGHILEVLR